MLSFLFFCFTLPGKSHGWRSLVSCSPWGLEESDMTERLHFHFSLSCIGEGNGDPLQCSCLENPRDGGAWWAAVYGVAQSRTQLTRLSSSSSSSNTEPRFPLLPPQAGNERDILEPGNTLPEYTLFPLLSLILGPTTDWGLQFILQFIVYLQHFLILEKISFLY